MFTRMFRMASSLAIVSAAYLLYSLVVSPFIDSAPAEPPSHVTGAQPGTPRPSNHLERLRKFFPPDAWELNDPILVQNPQFALLLREYETLEGGQVKLSPCTLMFFPDGFDAESDENSRMLVLRAPEGAILQFDEDCDLSRAKVGRLHGGRLQGEVTIQGNLASTNAASGNKTTDNELYIATRNVELQPDRLWTSESVEFRLGRNRGSGRDLTIEFNMAGAEFTKDSKPQLDVLKFVRLSRDVHLFVDLESKGLLPNTKPKRQPDEPVDKPANPQQPQPPIEVRCDGAFRFDVAAMTASFADRVDVVRLNPEGPSDQLNCELLTIQLQQRALDVSANGGTDPQKLGLVATKIEARGSPVVARAPSVGGQARGELLEFDVQTNDLRLSGTDRVSLGYQGNQLEAARIDYAAGESSLGKLTARGPGHIEATVPDSNGEKFRAAWNGELQIRPHEGRQLVSLVKEVTVQYANIGALRGDEIWFWLNETEEPRKTTVKNDTKNPLADSRFTPHSMLARGNVNITSQQLTATTEQLEVMFEPTEAVAAKNAGGKGRDLKLPDSKEAGGHYRVRGKLVQLRFKVPDKGSPQLSNVTVSGDVHVTEQLVDQSGPGPVVLMGDQLQLESAETPQALVTVTGRPAHIEARGLAMTGSTIRFDRGANQVRIDGGGKTSLPLDRGLQGEKLDAPQPLDVTWQGYMHFDGQTIHFDRNVVASTQQQQLTTGHLAVMLNKRVDFAQRVDKDKIDVARIACTRGVVMRSQSIEKDRIVSREQIEVADLHIDQASGNVHATGPGWLSSTRRGNSVKLAGAAGESANENQIVFLKVHFQRGITGNLHEKDLVLDDQVRCIYGPVASWETKLDANKADGPTGNEVLLTCQQLALREMGKAAEGGRAVELEASGNAIVEGEVFTARGHRLTYTTAKDLLVLEGTGQSDAILSHQQRIGGPVSQTSAQKILYWHRAGRVQAQGIRFGGGTFSGSGKLP